MHDAVGAERGQQCCALARDGQHQHRIGAAGAIDHGLRQLRAAGDQDLRAIGRRLARRMAGHHAGNGAACGFEHLQMLAQPLAWAAGNPDRFALAGGTGIGLQGEVQLGGVVQQALFEQALEYGTQPGRARAHALGQADPLPRQQGRRYHGHHLTGAARLGQQAGGGAALLADGHAIRRQGVAIASGCAGRRVRPSGQRQ